MQALKVHPSRQGTAEQGRSTVVVQMGVSWG